MFKELLTLGLLGGGVYYLTRAPATGRPATIPLASRSAPKGHGHWHQKEGGCSASGCSIGWENTHVSPTGWADSKVTREAYGTLPDRVQSLAKLKKMRGVLSVTLDT